MKRKRHISISYTFEVTNELNLDTIILEIPPQQLWQLMQYLNDKLPRKAIEENIQVAMKGVMKEGKYEF